ncbi:hypothetical protein CapIbe_001101, partial [Capra ibex]
PTDCSPPGSFVHGIFQARILEWGAIAFSDLPIEVTPKAVESHPRVSSWLCTT